MYAATGKIYGRSCYVAKLEKRTDGPSLIATEYKIYRKLHNGSQRVSGIPRAFFFGKYGSSYDALVIERLGRTLADQRPSSGRMCAKDVLVSGIQALKRLEFVHDRGVIHRDISPFNMMTGRQDQNILYLIDFGLAKQFRDKNWRHIPPRRNMHMVGMIAFASRNAHRGMELSRRDDLESLGYSLLYLLKGSLPWSRTNASKAGKVKCYITVEQLCKQAPSAFDHFFHHVRRLSFQERPNYRLLESVMQRSLRRLI